jgi:hypothetical protein
MAESSVALPPAGGVYIVKPYQIYTLDSDGRIIPPPAIIFCDSDAEALEQAEALAGGQAMEVRDGDRLVARLDPESTVRTPLT